MATNWAALQAQINHPLTPLIADANEHSGQLGLRTAIPLIANMLHLPLWLLLGGLTISGYVFFKFLIFSIYTKTGDKVTALLIPLVFVGIYVGKSFFVDLIGYMDGYAYLLLLCICFVRVGWLAMICMLIALFIDERCYLALPLCLLTRIALKPQSKLSWQTILHDRTTWAFIIITFFGLTVRLWLSSHYGLGAAMAAEKNLGLHAFRDNFPVLPLTLLTGLDFWLFALPIPGVYAWLRGERLFGIVYIAYCILAVLVMLLALDVTRSIAYLFPGVLLALVLMHTYETKAFFHKLLLSGTILTFIFPPLFAVGPVILWMGPILPRGIKIFWHIYQALSA